MVVRLAKVKLIFDDPLESSQTVIGMVIQIFLSTEKENYLLIQDLFSSQIYIVTSRYSGFDVSKISKKEMIVAIYIPKEAYFSFESPDFISSLTYYSIGSIITIDDNLQENSSGLT